jgi:hypothetical protein
MLFPDENVGNTRLFTHIYREVVGRLDPSRHYHPNSPWGDRDGYHNGTASGDSHVRDYLWWIPGNQWPNFLSETIRLTVPLRKTLERHLGADVWPAEGFDGRRRHWKEVPLPPAWLRMAIGASNPGGIASRLAPMWDLYEHDGTLDGLLYRLGAAAERYIRTTVERYRRGRPSDDLRGPRRTQGHLWWKFNDTWPLIYASLIDDLGEPNMAYYAMARAYRPIQVSIEVGDQVTAWVVNDTGRKVRGTLHLHQLDDRAGRPQASLSATVDLAPGASAPVIDARALGMLWINNPLAAQLVDEHGEELAYTIDWLVPERERWYPDATLTLTREGDDVLVGTSHLARCIELTGDAHGDAFGWDFSDNFFDLVAGRTHRIRLLGRHRHGTITARARNAPATILALSAG